MSRGPTAVLHLLNGHAEPPAICYGAVRTRAVQFAGISLLLGAGVLPETAAVLPGQVGRGGLPVDLLELPGVRAQLVPNPFLANLCLDLKQNDRDEISVRLTLSLPNRTINSADAIFI